MGFILRPTDDTHCTQPGIFQLQTIALFTYPHQANNYPIITANSKCTKLLSFPRKRYKTFSKTRLPKKELCATINLYSAFKALQGANSEFHDHDTRLSNLATSIIYDLAN